MCRVSNESSRTERPAKQRGLTLVELLVAISVLGFVAILGWRGLDGIVRARIALTSDLEQTRGMQLSFAQMQSDCAHLASASLLPNRVTLATEQGRLILVRTVSSDNQPSRLQVITYQLKDGELTRHESSATRDLMELDSLWLSAANGLDTTQVVKLQSDVTSMTIRVWVTGSWRTGVSALTPASGAPPPTTGPTASPPAPTGLEITLRLRGRDTGMQKIFLLGAV